MGINELLEQMKKADAPRIEEQKRKGFHPASKPKQSRQKTELEIKRAYIGSLTGRRR